MIETNEVLLKKNESWLHYTRPHEILQTDDISEVQTILRQTEKLVNEKRWHAAGFVSYEAAPAFDESLEVVEPAGFPLIWFGLYPEPVKFEMPNPVQNRITANWKPDVEEETYKRAIDQIKDEIAKGRTYQVNYTMRLMADFDHNEWDFFLQIARLQNKYAAYINTGKHVVCSASPELFFSLNKETIKCKPMKGTVNRGKTIDEDLINAEWLRNSNKNRAENVMIVDMIRNDLGKIAKIGSVRVPELFEVEKYPTVFQMTSTVEAETDKSIAEIFSALFPCASITGAPKVSTMRIISKLEPAARKIYTGSIGYIDPERRAQFNVAIRTALIDKEDNSAEYGIGGGIVWDSNSDDEYNEALLKSKVLDSNQPEYSLFETILWTNSDGFFLLEKHIARLQNSAEYFDFPFSRGNFTEYISEQSKSFNSPKRVKVTLDSVGNFSFSSQNFNLRNEIFKVKLATKPVDSNNPFLFHKTTHRDIYPAPSDGFNDVLLFNEKGELTEFTIGNLVVEKDGNLYTPPASCGLLPGTFRAKLLDEGKVREQILRVDEIASFTKIFLVNSLRKWVDIQIINE